VDANDLALSHSDGTGALSRCGPFQLLAPGPRGRLASSSSNIGRAGGKKIQRFPESEDFAIEAFQAAQRMRQVQLLLVCQDDDVQLDCQRVWPVQLPTARIGKPASNELKVFA